MRRVYLPLVAAASLAAGIRHRVLQRAQEPRRLRRAALGTARRCAPGRRMKENDEVQALDGTKGRWMEVLHWHGDQRLDPDRRGNTRRGWVHKRYVSECG